MIPVITCIKVGNKYCADYVNKLAAMVERHTNVQHLFICLTDDPTGLTCAHAPIGIDYPGWWSKLILFHPESALQKHRVFFLDLDTVIVGNIDFLLSYDGPFAILSDFYHPTEYGSAVMSIAPGFGQNIWTDYTEGQRGRWWGDQVWIKTCVPEADRWQEMYPGLIVSYKVHCKDGLPEGAAIVCFHGEPRPHEVQDAWVLEHWNERACSLTP